ncbi:cytochrome b/b6 domain-containing protein [Vibrio marisflavi]|uniref:Cytochrome b561 bacterial/Ni-hydrogenase domain-containing protein n=1 Tax=Vibrio marisflavi CECT 7928 TaxID=634439 RepID=A0ABM9A0K6_9VIBR|nr:cytochrome b/b6 domain-containing protein [Vibrio marisflavi]CAH0537029.1 hypothetical protein VMF7928_00871 [Vibrio marisflavi CECT 7928]
MAQVHKWDILVKLTHWTVAVLFLSNYFLTEEGSLIHQWVGYGVAAAVVVRLMWGLIARSPSRLSAFKPSIPSAISHVKEVFSTKKDDHVGHNPAGAIMIWLMWTLLLGTAFTGWSIEQNLFGAKDIFESVHEVLANLTMIAVGIHVSAIILMTKLTKKPYLSGMTLWQRKTDKSLNKV